MSTYFGDKVFPVMTIDAITMFGISE